MTMANTSEKMRKIKEILEISRLDHTLRARRDEKSLFRGFLGSRSEGASKLKDYASLTNDEFLAMLKEYHTLPELAGLWHRRTVLNTDLPRWSAEQRNMMKARKYELERANG